MKTRISNAQLPEHVLVWKLMCMLAVSRKLRHDRLAETSSRAAKGSAMRVAQGQGGGEERRINCRQYLIGRTGRFSSHASAWWYFLLRWKRSGVCLFGNVLLLFWIKLRENMICMICFSAVQTGKLSRGGNACGSNRLGHAKANAAMPTPSSTTGMGHSPTRCVKTSLVPMAE